MLPGPAHFLEQLCTMHICTSLIHTDKIFLNVTVYFFIVIFKKLYLLRILDFNYYTIYIYI